MNASSDNKQAVSGPAAMGASTIAVVYSLCALVAMAANIAAQDLAIRLYAGPYAVTIALAFGTLIGLVVKYELDKRYVFRFRARDLRHDSATFLLYSAMGIVTTVIFWGSELAFDHIFDSKTWRYIGGIIGLTIGYLTKYQLDRRFVFKTI